MKRSTFCDLPREDLDRYLRGLGYQPDTREDVRESRREITYSKQTQQVMMPVQGRFVISVAGLLDGVMTFTGQNLLAESPDMDNLVESVIKTARARCIDADEDVSARKKDFRRVWPKGPDHSVEWNIVPYAVQSGAIVVRCFSSISGDQQKARAVGTDAIRVAVVYDANGQCRGLGSEQRVNRVGTVEGLLHRLGERLAQAEKVKVKMCVDCGSPAYADSGRCILPECRRSKIYRVKGT